MNSSTSFRSSQSFQKTVTLEDDNSETASMTYIDEEAKMIRLFRGIKSKINESGIRISKILTACEKRDRNNDGILHVDDFEEVLNSVIGMDILTRREKKLLIDTCNFDKKYGNVSYMKLIDILEDNQNKDDRFTREKWHDTNNTYVQDEFTNVKPGSIGDWLKNVACPAEVTNYKLFISHLEMFEKESGMRIKLGKDGCMTVPLGPDLKAQISFKTTT